MSSRAREEVPTHPRRYKSLVEGIYMRIYDMVAQGIPIDEAVMRFLPALITEMDNRVATMPYMKRVLFNLFRDMWSRHFPKIPRPEFDPERDSVLILYKRIIQVLEEHAEDLYGPDVQGKSFVYRSESRYLVGRAVAQFMDAIAREFFRLCGDLS